MKTRKLYVLVAVAMVFILAASIGGVFATWNYASVGVNNVSNGSAISMGHWANLPTGSEGEGNNQQSALEEIVQNLNNKDSALNKNLSGRLEGAPYFGGNTKWAPRNYYGDMDKYFKAPLNMENTENVNFIVQNPNVQNFNSSNLDDCLELNVFTTDQLKKEVENKTYSNGKEIQIVYKTTLRRTNPNSPWQIVYTEEGKAKLDYYDESFYLVPNWNRIPSFDPDTWQPL